MLSLSTYDDRYDIGGANISRSITIGTHPIIRYMRGMTDGWMEKDIQLS